MALALCGCKQEEERPVDYGEILYKDVKPIGVHVDEHPMAEHVAALTKRIDLRYPMMVDDTLDVCILEFKSDVYAMDYYINSGRFQGILPILRGAEMEQSIRSDARIFIFTHDSFRRYERSDLEQYVRAFPGYHGGFPQEFLSLPFEHREANKTSIQTRNFLGVKSFAYDVDVVYFTAGDGVNGMASRLSGGRVVVVWGYLSWPDLERKFFVASDRVFEARY